MNTAHHALIGQGALHRFVQLAEQDPSAAFFSVDDKGYTRNQFRIEVGKVAGALSKLGVGPGDVVALCTTNRLEWCAAFWGCVSLGAVPAPLNPSCGIWELQQLLPLLAPKLIIATTTFQESDPSQRIREALPLCPMITLDGTRLQATSWEAFLFDVEPLPIDARPVGEKDLLLFACTSGTTGNPKILAVPHLGFMQSQLDMADYLGLGAEDHLLLSMPLFHQGGFGMGLQALLAGGHAMYVERFDPPSFLAKLATSRATVAQLSPTLAKLLLTVPTFSDFDLSAWRMAYFAGELLSDDLASRFWHDQSLRVINVIGSSETGTMLVWDSVTDSAYSASDLVALPFTQAQLLDTSGGTVGSGEIGILWVHTDALLLRYESNPRLTAASLRDQDGLRWFCTGDLAHQLANGRFRLLGRAKRVIKRGPNLVHPEEIEAFLLGHPKIAAVALGMEPHEIFGESLVAWIQPAPGVQLCRSDITKYCQNQISSFKIPDRFLFVSALPTEIGKIQHLRLRETITLP